MDEDDEFGGWLEDGEALSAQKFDPFDLVVIAGRVTSSLIKSVSDGAFTLSVLLAQHSNYRLERRRWAADIGKQIEAMTSGN